MKTFKPNQEQTDFVIKNLVRGDLARIAKKTGMSRRHIYRIIYGESENSRVFEIALNQAAENHERINRLNSFSPKQEQIA